MTAWSDEFAPPSLAALGQGVRAALGLTATAIGIKGDQFHLSGYHRSRRWILTDPASEDGSGDYSVTHPLDQGGDQNWLAGLDITPKSVEQMIAVSMRLDAAMRADLLPNVREFYGNTNGDRIVDGWDDLTHRAATSDDSHLWHVHISFYRSRAGNDHTDVLRVITGADLEEDMSFEDTDRELLVRLNHGLDGLLGNLPRLQPGSSWGTKTNEVHNQLAAILKAAGAPTQVTLSPEQLAELKADLRAGLPTLAEIATAVADENARRQQN
jgi:hypothetical protein